MKNREQCSRSIYLQIEGVFMHWRRAKKIFIIWAIVAPFIANSQVSPSVKSESTVKSGGVLEKIKPSRITYFSIFTGPNLGSFDDPKDENGVIDENSLSNWNQISLQWKINDRFNFVLNPRFSNNYNIAPGGKSVVLEDAVMGISGTWFKSGNFSFAGGMNTITPVTNTKETRDDGLIFNPGGFQIANYKLNSRYSVGSWIWGRASVYDRPTTSSDERFDYFYAPYVSMNINDKIGSMVFYQFNGELDNNYRLEQFSDDSLNFLMTFSINKFLTLEPIITFYRGTDYRVSDGNFSMWLSGRLF